MKSLYVSTLIFALLASPGLQARGLQTTDTGSARSKASGSQAPAAKDGTVIRSVSGKPIKAKVAGKARAVVPVVVPVVPIGASSIQLNKPSLLEQARTQTREEILAVFDSDLDGKLNPKEASAARQETEKRSRLKLDLLKRFDDNKNDRLDAAEMSRARAEFAANRRKQVLTKYDSNKNGLLDPVERKRLQEDRRRAAALESLQRRFDLNHDSLLDSREAAAMRSYTQEQRQLGLDPLDEKATNPGLRAVPALAKSKAGSQVKNASHGEPKQKPASTGAEKPGVKSKTSAVKPNSAKPKPKPKPKQKEQRRTLNKGRTEGFALPSPGR